MQIDILTLFPEMFSALEHSIIKRARDANKIRINLVDFRKYSKDKHKKVDDFAFGGGAGLVLMPQPIVDCVEDIDPKHEAHRICLSPAAPVLTQTRVRELSQHKRLLLLCGHYEGIDQRAIDLCFDECISIGEYVLTGGEIPAMVLVDAVARHIPGVINEESVREESFSENSPSGRRGGGAADGVGNWEYPQYTRPREYRGMVVPEILLSGNHAQINKWKRGNHEN